MSKRKPIFGQVGVTTNHNPVICDVFELHDTHGIPLFITLTHCCENQIAIDWVDYFTSAFKANRALIDVFKSVKHQMSDVYGQKYTDEWEIRAKLCLMDIIKTNGTEKD